MFDQFLAGYNQKKLKRVREKFESEDNFEKFVQYYDYVKSNIPLRYIQVVLEQNPLQKRVREFDLVNDSYKEPATWDEVSCPFLENIERACKNSLSFILYGYNESGKTIESVRLLITAIARGLSGYYINFKRLLSIYNDAEFGSDSESQRVLTYLKYCDFLVIDELGKESSTTDNVIGALEEIVKERNANNCSTVLVTNIDVSDTSDSGDGFLNRYGNSVWNALYRNFRAFEFSPDGEFRQKTRIDWDDVL